MKFVTSGSGESIEREETALVTVGPNLQNTACKRERSFEGGKEDLNMVLKDPESSS